MALLPRVSEVLSRAVAPISSSNERGSVASSTTGRPPADFKRETPQREKSRDEKPKTPLRVIKREAAPEVGITTFKEKSPPSAESKQQALAVVTPPLGTQPSAGVLSVAHRILDLLKSFGQNRGELVRWVGSRTYRSLSGESRKGKFRRGAMLDEEIE